MFKYLFAVLVGLEMLMATPAGAQNTNQINIAIVSRTIFYLPVWLAAERGYFKDAGLDVRIEVFDNAEKINAALRDNAVQIAISTPESIIVDALKGGSLRMVAGNAGRLPHFVIARPEIHSIADLRGKTIGVLSNEEGTTYLVPEVTRSAGLQPTDYTVKAVGGAPTRWRLLRSGEIDAGLQPFPLSYEAEAAGFSNLGPLAKFVPDWQFTSVNVDLRWAEGHRAELVSALRAMQRGLDAIATDHDTAINVAARELKTDAKLAERAIQDTARLGILTPNMDISAVGTRRVHEALVAAKLVPNEPLMLERVSDTRFLRESRDIVLRDLGSQMVGGTQASLSGQPVKEVRYAANAAPLRTDPNGTYQTGQAYVQWMRLSEPRGLPVLFLNGGTGTGAMWETTPDGRPGWREIMLREGHDVWQVDAPGKGRAGYQPFPAITPGEPIFRPNEGSWTLLRVGTRYSTDAAQRQAFSGVAFPVDAFETFMKGAVPRFAGQDEAELAAYGELIAKIGPCIIIAQSSGAYFATQIAARRPDLVRAIVAVEITATPDLTKVDGQSIAKVPQLLLWGDNLQSSDYWRRTRANAEEYSRVIRDLGGKVDIVDLPVRGLTGNTHQMMMDRNSEAIATLVVNWLSENEAAR